MKGFEGKELIDVKELPLEEWLYLLEVPPKRSYFVDYTFPTDQHRSEYLSSIDRRTEDEVASLIRHFLVLSGGLGCDEYHLHYLLHCAEKDPQRFHLIREREFAKRLLKSITSKEVHPWEGITWILDLLPHFPSQALQVLDAYLMAHASWLPDGRISGLSDLSDLIRAKFIGEPKGNQQKLATLKALSPQQFECLVERLYNALGYETKLTPHGSDGGRDVIAKRFAPAQREALLIECKRYTVPVKAPAIRGLLGVVSNEKANKGVMVSTSSFTRGAKGFANANPQIELINGTELVELMNENLGARWPLRIGELVADSLRTINKIESLSQI